MTKRRFLTAGIVLFASASLNYRAFAQSASYAGRPFVPNARPNANDPVAGFVSGFGRAQMVGESVVFVPMSGVSAGGVFRGRDGPLTKVAAPGTTGPDGNQLFFHDGFARGAATPYQTAEPLTASSARPSSRAVSSTFLPTTRPT